MLARFCQRRRILLIADEIFTGFGRTGTLFAVSADRVAVDLLCCGKALAGGLPIGVVLGRRSVFRAWDRQGEALHTSTFMANPLSCAAALAVLDVLEEEDLTTRAAQLGRVICRRVEKWQQFDLVKETRGRGLLWGIELSSGAHATRVARLALNHGLILLLSGSRGDVLQISPPLSISEEQLGRALDILERLLAEEELHH